jgi:hypothetical protein
MFLNILLASLIALASIPPLPFERYSDVKGVERIDTTCDGKVTRWVGGGWWILSSEEKDIFIRYDAQGSAQFVYFATGRSDGAITVVEVLTFQEAEKKYPSPCEWFKQTAL